MLSDLLDCSAVSDVLAMEAGGDQSLTVDEQHHLAACLHCQAERIRYRRLMREMRCLRPPTLAVAAADTRQLELEILSRIDDHDQRLIRRLSSRLVAAIGGVAAGAAAASVFALAARRRRAIRLV